MSKNKIELPKLNEAVQPSFCQTNVGRRLSVEYYLENLSKYATIDNSDCWYEAPCGEIHEKLKLEGFKI